MPKSKQNLYRGRVLIIVENSWVPMDRRVWYEATTLRDAGWHVSIICPAAKGAHAGSESIEKLVVWEAENLEGINVFRFPLVFAEQGVLNYFREYFYAFFSILYLTFKIWRREGFDILHISNPPDIFFPIALFYRLFGVAIIFDHHDLFTEMIAHRYHGLLGQIFYMLARFCEYLTYKVSNFVIVTNNSYQNIAQDRGGLPINHIIVVRNGPKLEDFKPVKPDMSLKHNHKNMVCFVGIMGEEDGVLELVEVIDHVVNKFERKDILFTMIGDGSARDPAMEKLSSLGLSEHVNAPGMIRDDLVLRKYMSAADIFVSPEPDSPLNSKSTFVKIGEYMSMGKAIVAFDLPETRFTASDSAVYVPNGDVVGFAKAIIKLLDEPHLSQKMGQRGRQRVIEKIAWKHQAHNLTCLYERFFS